MTIGDEHLSLVADFLLDLALDGKITAELAQRLHVTMSRPGATAKAARELARFDRQVLRIKPVPRRQRWSLAARRRRADAILAEVSRIASEQAPDEQACNCYSNWYCVVHNPGWLP